MFALLASILFFFFPICAMSIAFMAAEVVPASCDAIICPSGYQKLLPLDPTVTPTQQTCCFPAQSFSVTGPAVAEPPAPPPCPHTPEEILNDALNTILQLTTSTTTSTTTISTTTTTRTTTTGTTTTTTPVPCTTHEHTVNESVARDILRNALTDIARGNSSSSDKAARLLDSVFSTTTTTVTEEPSTKATVTMVKSTEANLTVTTVTSTQEPSTNAPDEKPSTTKAPGKKPRKTKAPHEKPSTTKAPGEKPPTTKAPGEKPPTLDPTKDVVDALSKLAASLSTSPAGNYTFSSLEAALSKLQAAVQARNATHAKTAAALAVDPTATVSAMKSNTISTGPTEDLATELPKSASIRRAQPPSP